MGFGSTYASNGMRKLHRHAHRDLIVSNGQVTELGASPEEAFYDRQYGRHGARSYQHNRHAGTIGEKYLDYAQSLRVDQLELALQKRGYSLGEFMDYMAMQLVRPSAGHSVLASSNYLLQSFFIDVGSKGQQDQIFNQWVAEGIGVVFEFITQQIAEEKLDGTPLQLLQQGFTESYGKTTPGTQKQKLMDALDDHFDDAAGAIKTAIDQKKPRFENLKSGANSVYSTFGETIAAEAERLMARDPARAQRIIDNPAEAVQFYNEYLGRWGLSMKSDVVDKYEGQIAAKNNRIAELEQQVTNAGKNAGEKPDPLKETRKDSWFQRMFKGAGRG